MQGAELGTYLSATDPPGYVYAISDFFWGAPIVVALFVLCLFAVKAIRWFRNRTGANPLTVEGVHAKDPGVPSDGWDQAISRPSADNYDFAGHYGDELGGLGSMTPREQEELFSVYAPRKVRKVMKERRKARLQAEKKRGT